MANSMLQVVALDLDLTSMRKSTSTVTHRPYGPGPDRTHRCATKQLPSLFPSGRLPASPRPGNSMCNKTSSPSRCLSLPAHPGRPRPDTSTSDKKPPLPESISGPQLHLVRTSRCATKKNPYFSPRRQTPPMSGPGQSMCNRSLPSGDPKHEIT